MQLQQPEEEDVEEMPEGADHAFDAVVAAPHNVTDLDDPDHLVMFQALNAALQFD